MTTRQPQETSALGPMPQLLRQSEVLGMTRLTKSQLYRLLADEQFPNPRRIGPRTSRWVLESVRSWMETLPEATYTSPPDDKRLTTPKDQTSGP